MNFGFGAGSQFELALAGLLLLTAVCWRSSLEPWAQKFAGRTAWCMALLAILPVALRLLLLANHPVPTPDIYDEFGHLLVADTLRHFRLANPPHQLSRFFETFFVLQQPTYSAIYPPGQGILLAVGWTLFGLPWAGVLLAMAALSSLCYWMLRAWTTPGWALVGGILAIVEFGPLCQWSNNYWGGGLAAAAGCLVFGALPRLGNAVHQGNAPRQRDAVLLGLGLALHLVTRPFESIFLFLSAALFFLPALPKPKEMRALARVLPEVALVLLPAVALLLFQNKAVTGSWTTMPEMLSQFQYGVPAALTFQTPAVPHRELTQQQALDYRMQVAFHSGRETLASFLLRLEYRVRYYRFFFLAPLYLALPAFLTKLREYRYAWVALTLAIFALGVNFFPAFQFHYVAAVTCLFVLVSVAGLERIASIRIAGRPAGREAARLIVFLCCAQFAFWYGLHAFFENADFAPALRSYETWDGLNHGNPARRILVNRELAKIPGRLLVLVHYGPHHIFQDEWVYNRADIDSSRIVWARDLGPQEDEELRRYFSDRTVLLLDPDARPPSLAPLAGSSADESAPGKRSARTMNLPGADPT